MNFIKRAVKNIMREYSGSFRDLNEIAKRLEQDPYIRLRVKKNMIRLGLEDRTVATMYLGDTATPAKTSSFTNFIRDHFDYPLDLPILGVNMFLTSMAVSGWLVVDGTLYEENDHYTVHLHNHYTAQSAVCHFSLNTLSFLCERNPSEMLFSDLFQEM